MVHATKRLELPAISLPSALLIALSLLTAACGGESDPDCAEGSTDPACVPPTNACPTTPRLKFVPKQLMMPSGTNHYSYDIDGNGTAENKVEDVIEGLETAGLDIQNAINGDVEDGDFLMLVEIQGSSLLNGCANVILRDAMPVMMPPGYDGNDTFQPKADATPVKLVGNISNGFLTTTAPKNQPPASLATLNLAITITLDFKLPLILYGARIEGQVSPNGVTNGRLHGALRKEDVEEFSLPVVAQAVTQRINEDPGGTGETAAMIAIFESDSNTVSQAKCSATPAKCCATNPATCVITPEEIGQSTIIQQILTPDVQMFQNGAWSPKAGGSAPESLSFGIGFVGIKAAF
jgi:hypothetical protein